MFLLSCSVVILLGRVVSSGKWSNVVVVLVGRLRVAKGDLRVFKMNLKAKFKSFQVKELAMIGASEQAEPLVLERVEWGRKLRAFRRSRALSQMELAEEIGKLCSDSNNDSGDSKWEKLSDTTISKWENGRNGKIGPSLKYRAALRQLGFPDPYPESADTAAPPFLPTPGKLELGSWSVFFQKAKEFVEQVQAEDFHFAYESEATEDFLIKLAAGLRSYRGRQVRQVVTWALEKNADFHERTLRALQEYPELLVRAADFRTEVLSKEGGEIVSRFLSPLRKQFAEGHIRLLDADLEMLSDPRHTVESLQRLAKLCEEFHTEFDLEKLPTTPEGQCPLGEDWPDNPELRQHLRAKVEELKALSGTLREAAEAWDPWRDAPIEFLTPDQRLELQSARGLARAGLALNLAEQSLTEHVDQMLDEITGAGDGA